MENKIRTSIKAFIRAWKEKGWSEYDLKTAAYLAASVIAENKYGISEPYDELVKLIHEKETSQEVIKTFYDNLIS